MYSPLDRLASAVEQKSRPPAWLRQRVGSLSTFEGSSGEYVAYLKLLCNLKAGDSVLDIGCGCGNTALSFTGQFPLSGYTHYVGVDIDPDAISWCTKNINSYFFTNLRLPDSSFDVILAKSLFTHLTEEETTRYLQEIKRLLAPEGRALLTFFLLREPVGPNAHYTFLHKLGDYTRCLRKTNPRLGIAYDPEWVYDTLRSLHLYADPPHYGEWGGDPGGLSFQDIVIVEHE
jgi:SAM-dependent methyltransferase